MTHARRIPSPARRAAWRASIETAALAILEAPPRDGETSSTVVARQEAEILHLFAQLSADESSGLLERLSAEQTARLVELSGSVRQPRL